MADRGTQGHKVRLDTAQWSTLTGIAARLVHDTEMPLGAKPGDARISAMLRLIANGDLIVYRPASTENPTG